MFVMNADQMKAAESRFLYMCADDFTPVCAAFDSVRYVETPGTFLEEKAVALQLVTTLIRARLVEPGGWVAPVGFKQWEGSREDLCRRVTEHFEPLSSRPDLADPLWFLATEAGKALVRSVNET